MRTYGPLISIGFYMAQLLHAFLFYQVFGPALHSQFVNYPAVAYFGQALGWLLCYKVTYLYYRVSTTSPGVPSRDLSRDNNNSSQSNKKLPIDIDVAQRYSTDMAEILRYSSIAASDFETFENAMG